MKGFAIQLLGVILVALIACSIQSIYADHLETGIGIFKNENSLNLVSTKDSKYQAHIQVEVRNAQGQLISVSEDSRGEYIPHEITDNTFNEKFGKREIIIIDNIKYEKVQFTDTLDAKQLMDNNKKRTSDFIGVWKYQVCEEIDGHGYTCIPVFRFYTAYVSVTVEDIVTSQWTILRALN